MEVDMGDYLRRGVYRQHDRVQKDPGGPGKTREEFAAECDINTIMARYAKTGVVTHFSQRQPRYLDLGEVPDFHSAMQVMVDADRAFSQLPALVRKEFDNDPAQFVEFASDPKNIDKLREWQLAPPATPEPQPQKVEVVNNLPSEVPPKA